MKDYDAKKKMDEFDRMLLFYFDTIFVLLQVIEMNIHMVHATDTDGFINKGIIFSLECFR